ncbi:MAG: histidine kinase, partial [Bacteroidota bacterium]
LWENKQKATESRLQSLRLQMNPHFLFNALNSIQQMILANEEMVATRYLSRFSKLLRTVLIHSDKESISLREEIEAEELRIPTLLIQPFVENAIWHGLMHKEGNRHLSIRFNETDDFLQCVIEDNGVGRKKSQEQKNLHGLKNTHTGKGISVSEERVKTLKGVSGKTGNILINT